MVSMDLELTNRTSTDLLSLLKKHSRLTHVSLYSGFNFIFQELLTRLRGAKIDGFEGAKMLELKINRKRLAKGEEKIDL